MGKENGNAPKRAQRKQGFNVRSDREYISQYRDTDPRGQPYRRSEKVGSELAAASAALPMGMGPIFWGAGGKRGVAHPP